MPSEAIVDFLSALVGSNPGSGLLDPWAGVGVLIAGLVESSAAESYLGILNRTDLGLIAHDLAPEAVWREGDWLLELRALRAQGSTFDLIASILPLGVRRNNAAESVAIDRRFPQLSLDLRIVSMSSSLLTSNGRAFFVLSDASLRTLEHLGPLLIEVDGLHIWSVIALPASWNPTTSIGGNVVEIRRSVPEELFVAKASADTPNSALLANCGARRLGKIPELGSLVASDEFSIWHAGLPSF